MADLHDIITASVKEATADDSAVDATTEDTDTPTETSETTETTDTTVVPPVVEADPPDDLDTELEGFGIKAPIEGQRENRIPYSRVRKIVENSRKKLSESHAVALKEHTDKVAVAAERLKYMDAVDNLITTNPDRYMELLAKAQPAYAKFLGASETKTVDDDPKPAPDVKYDDGTIGYSPKSLDALLDWQARNIESKVTKKLTDDYTKRFGPIEQDWNAQRLIKEKMPIVDAQIANARNTWGILFDTHEADILKVLKDNETMAFDTAVSRVLVPKMQAVRETMRADILKEMNKRPAVAVRSAPAATTEHADTGGPRSIEDVIREQIATLK